MLLPKIARNTKNLYAFEANNLNRETRSTSLQPPTTTAYTTTTPMPLKTNIDNEIITCVY